MKILYYCIVFCLIIGCKKTESNLFQLVDSKQSNITFENRVQERDTFNILTNEYIFNGGGVAVYDFDKNGLPDLFFTGSMVSNKLYLNQGKFRFEDITKSSGLETKSKWSTGIAIADINDDGWMDIYIGAAMHKDNRTNMLFINQGKDSEGKLHFEEQAASYGIADSGNTMGATFLDYDQDGDLDLYVLNNEQSEQNPTNYRKKIIDGTAVSNDRLYQNNGNGTFTDVTKKAGILYEGYGLSVAVADVNKDGWSDLYITNDYITNDLLYINQQDGTFKNEIKTYIPYQSKFSMGLDISDFNADGYLDIITLDMLAEDHEGKKTSLSKISQFTEVLNKRWKYQPQYIRNMLFMGNGSGAKFSEIGRLAGVYQTDWSWSPLFIDVDNDSFKDLLITNGFPRNITDMDFANYRQRLSPYLSKGKLIDSIPVVEIPNYAYKNINNFNFKDTSKSWGLDIPSFSNGAVFTDLDLDGDLDYVVNNINQKAFVFQNKLEEQNPKPKYIQLELKGPAKNKLALGTKIKVTFQDNSFEYQEQQLTRGYMSSVDPVLHFGLGEKKAIKKIEILWPDISYSAISNPKIETRLSISYNEIQRTEKHSLEFPFTPKNKENTFKKVNEKLNINFVHKENEIQDFSINRLLPNKQTQNGPPLVVGDFNGDSQEDFIVGNGAGFSPQLFLQLNNKFIEHPMISDPALLIQEFEDIAAFDVENDGDLDLYLMSGGNEFQKNDPRYQDRILINDGKGNFKYAPQCLPKLATNGSVVRPFDYDADGDIDLFIGGRNIPNEYPFAEKSFLLENVGGKFFDVTQTKGSALQQIGIVEAGEWIDLNNDGQVELVLTGPFQPIQIFTYDDEKLKKVTANPSVENLKGLWRSITFFDKDQDGDNDIVVGNYGKNNMYSISKKTPLVVLAKDIDNNGSIDPVFFCYQKNLKGTKDLYPVQFWGSLIEQSPVFRQKFKSYKDFSKKNFAFYQNQEEFQGATKLDVNEDASVWLENKGDFEFEIHYLPTEAQVSPINTVFFDPPFNQNPGKLLIGGNDFGGTPFEGNQTSFQGLVLENSLDQKGMTPVKVDENGFLVNGDVRQIKTIRLSNNKKIYLVAQNQDVLLALAKTD